VTEYRIFNEIRIFSGERSLHALFNNSSIKALDTKDRFKVAFSLREVSPQQRRAYELLLKDEDSMKTFSQTCRNLYEKILKISRPEKILLIAILRSGLLISETLNYLADKNGATKFQIIGLTPNYINSINIDRFKNFILNTTRIPIFVDSWCSDGITFNVIKNFWHNLFPKKEFRYAVASNISKIEDLGLIYATKTDMLFPWSIAITDQTGLSNFFLDRDANRSATFYLSPEKRQLETNGKLYDYIHSYPNNEFSNDEVWKNCFHSNNLLIKGAKWGINETIKAIEKGEAIEVLVDVSVPKKILEILSLYKEAYGIKLKIENNVCRQGVHCAVIRKSF